MAMIHREEMSEKEEFLGQLFLGLLSHFLLPHLRSTLL